MAKIKIPANVSSHRRALAEAIARKKAGATKSNPASNIVRAKAGQEAADARRKARAAELSAAEKDLELQKLRDDLANAQKDLLEKTPLAKKWEDHDHKRRERLIAKFPVEERKRVGKLDADALELLAEARGFAGDGAAAGSGQAGAKATSSILSMEDANKISKTDPKAFNEWMDKVASSEIKLDSKTGAVIK